MFDIICDALHREMEKLAQKYDDGNELTAQELDHIDKMAHALKCITTYDAMVGDGGYERRSRTSGRYRDDHYRRY